MGERDVEVDGRGSSGGHAGSREDCVNDWVICGEERGRKRKCKLQLYTDTPRATTLSTRATTLSTRAIPSTHSYRLQSYPRVLLHPLILTDYSHVHACYTLSHDVVGHALVDSRVRELELVRPTQALVVLCDLCTLQQRSTTRQLRVCE